MLFKITGIASRFLAQPTCSSQIHALILSNPEEKKNTIGKQVNQIVQLIFKGLFSSNTLLFQVNQPLFQIIHFNELCNLVRLSSNFFRVQNASVVVNIMGPARTQSTRLAKNNLQHNSRFLKEELALCSYIQPFLVLTP